MKYTLHYVLFDYKLHRIFIFTPVFDNPLEWRDTVCS